MDIAFCSGRATCEPRRFRPKSEGTSSGSAYRLIVLPFVRPGTAVGHVDPSLLQNPLAANSEATLAVMVK